MDFRRMLLGPAMMLVVVLCAFMLGAAGIDNSAALEAAAHVRPGALEVFATLAAGLVLAVIMYNTCIWIGDLPRRGRANILEVIAPKADV